MLFKSLSTTAAALLALLIALGPLPAAALDKAAVEAQFQTWLTSSLWPDAKAAGITQKAFRQAVSGLRLNWDLPDLAPPGQAPPKERKQSQAEFSSPGSYFSEKRLKGLATTGRSLSATHAGTLRKVEKAYGVPGSILLAIWGRESGFGRADIPHPAIEVLATKAFMSTRKDMFRGELIAALHILDSGDVAAGNLKGSWAGALGQPQFMPSSFLKYAVDFDGDGKRDIWTSVPDTLASIANYLVKKGWQAGRSWGEEVRLPDAVSCAGEGPDRAKPLAQWAASGVARISGKPLSKGAAEAMLLLPAGTHGPEFIVSPNFYVIKEYNNSDLYALFIGNLADRIASGSGAFETPFGSVGSMLRSDVLAMQQTLAAQGYDVGRVDGLPGFKTRRSIGEWQTKAGLAATCYPDETLKSTLR